MKKWYYVFSIFTIFALLQLYLLHRQATVTQHQRNLNACIKKFETIRDRATRIEPVKLYPFKERYQKLGYRNSRGNVVIQPRFAEAYFFSNGRASVTNKLWYKGFIDSRGELVIPHKFVAVSDFIDGLAIFSGTKDEREKRGVIDLNGNIILEIHNVHPTIELYIRKKGFVGFRNLNPTYRFLMKKN
jgi:WG containing repeat